MDVFAETATDIITYRNEIFFYAAIKMKNKIVIGKYEWNM